MVNFMILTHLWYVTIIPGDSSKEKCLEPYKHKVKNHSCLKDIYIDKMDNVKKWVLILYVTCPS